MLHTYIDLYYINQIDEHINFHASVVIFRKYINYYKFIHFSISLLLSRQLREENIVLVEFIELAKNILQMIAKLRSNAVSDFKTIYTEVITTC